MARYCPPFVATGTDPRCKLMRLRRRSMDIPDSLTHRIELFRQTGRVFKVPPELFGENSWIQVMMGQGLLPEHQRFIDHYCKVM